MIGVWFLNEFLILNNIYGNDLPNSILITELGPGRGTLMADIIRVIILEFNMKLHLKAYK